ncbi:hypothetical protein [Sphingobacterium hotanense]|uniref:hypothetical protein n=1 Tax=Sphingobacterium hotanense TaxID=649196 RepID=UPI0021A40A46|nr:hypothetical protein [Sphingobacterium hotanense]MCT1526445.1 hypothetical protein [Sphingobacterium hotanense]
MIAVGTFFVITLRIFPLEQIDNEMLKRLKEVQGPDDENRAHIFATIDAFIKAAKLKSIAL